MRDAVSVGEDTKNSAGGAKYRGKAAKRGEITEYGRGLPNQARRGAIGFRKVGD